MSGFYRGIKLFSGNGNAPLALAIANSMGLPVGEVALRHFNDGEIHVQIKENVRGEDVFVIQPTCVPTNNNLMELFFMVDALRRASAGRITAVIPYFGYARQDRKDRPRVSISARLVADLLETTKVDRILCMDLHAAQIQGFFRIPMDHLFAAPSLVEYFNSRQQLEENLIVVSPDIGGTARARSFADRMNTSLAIIDKRRPAPNEVEIMNIIGDVKGRFCLMIDDIIDTAGTLAKGAKALMSAGAVGVSAYATHGVLSPGAEATIDESVMTEVVITDTIPQHTVSPKIKICSIANIFGKAIWSIHDELSVGSLFI